MVTNLSKDSHLNTKSAGLQLLHNCSTWRRHTSLSGEQGQVRADKKQVVQQYEHCRSSSGTNSNASRSAFTIPCQDIKIVIGTGRQHHGVVQLWLQ